MRHSPARHQSIGGKLWIFVGLLALIGLIAVGYMGASASPPAQKTEIKLDGKQFGLN